MHLTNRVLALAAFAAASLSLAATPMRAAVDNAPSVEMAPVVERPLQPALAQEVPQRQPTPQHVLVPGHWRWQDGNFAWIPARWQAPPAPGATWTAPRWEQRANGYVLVPGYWEHAATAADEPAAPPVAADRRVPDRVDDDEPVIAPPVQRHETVRPAPSRSHVWIPGYWEWRGRGRGYAWVPGYWSVPPRQTLTWVPGRWDRRGNHYVFIPGYWREQIARPGPGGREYGPGRNGDYGQGGEYGIVRNPPPPPRREFVPPRPSGRHVWVPGYWRAAGPNLVWVAGRWTLPPNGGRYSWVAPRWERRGGGYLYIEGYWR